ncbi:MAG: hypothetical protein WAM14_13870 [Candidatus Nitrosopolaris sp.]
MVVVKGYQTIAVIVMIMSRLTFSNDDNEAAVVSLLELFLIDFQEYFWTTTN